PRSRSGALGVGASRPLEGQRPHDPRPRQRPTNTIFDEVRSTGCLPIVRPSGSGIGASWRSSPASRYNGRRLSPSPACRTLESESPLVPVSTGSASMDDGLIRLGVNGCGGFGLFALQHFTQVSGVKLVGMAGTHRPAALAAAARFGVENVDDVGGLLGREDV